MFLEFSLLYLSKLLVCGFSMTDDSSVKISTESKNCTSFNSDSLFNLLALCVVFLREKGRGTLMDDDRLNEPEFSKILECALLAVCYLTTKFFPFNLCGKMSDFFQTCLDYLFLRFMISVYASDGWCYSAILSYVRIRLS